MDFQRNREKTALALRGRILNVLPAASYQMDRFLQLVDVVVSDRTQTACVEVGPQPRLHLNAKFVDRHCKRDEHLLMLVLHELYHIILGHTRLFSRLTLLHNIAFDAVINSMLCRQFREQVYLDFFQKLNNDSRFPARLLRPPQGWPDIPKEPPKSVRDSEKKVLGRLYGEKADTVTYHEVFELLKRSYTGNIGENFILLGDHDSNDKSGSTDEMAANDALLRNILRDITEAWPADANLGTGRGDGSKIFDFLMPKPKSPRRQFLAELRKLLERAGTFQPDQHASYAWRKTSTRQESTTYLPNSRDRLAHSKEIFYGAIPILYRAETDRRRPRWMPQDITHIYVDVSGSMEQDLPWLVAALDPLHRKGLCRIFAFSTVVYEVKAGALLSGKIQNTYGTDINCVYNHLVGLTHARTPKRVVILTDGYVGAPDSVLEIQLNRRKVELHVGLIGGSFSHEFARHAASIQNLPIPHNKMRAKTR